MTIVEPLLDGGFFICSTIESDDGFDEGVPCDRTCERETLNERGWVFILSLKGFKGFCG